MQHWRAWAGVGVLILAAMAVGLVHAQETEERKEAPGKAAAGDAQEGGAVPAGESEEEPDEEGKEEKDPLRAKILQLLQAQGGGRSFKDQFLEGFKMGLTGMPDTFFEDLITDEDIRELEDLVIGIYKKHYDADEIDELLAFFETPLGKKYAAKQQQVFTETFQASQFWGMKLGPRIMEKMDEMMEEGDLPEDPMGGVFGDLVDARKTGNETAAIGALRTISSVQAQFREGDRENDKVLDYASSLTELSNAGLIDDLLGAGKKSGYFFALSGSTFDWQATATPIDATTGTRNFIVCIDGVVRFSGEDPATCSSPAIR